MKRILIVLFATALFASCSRVSGTYINESGGLYDQIEFVGNTGHTRNSVGMQSINLRVNSVFTIYSYGFSK